MSVEDGQNLDHLENTLKTPFWKLTFLTIIEHQSQLSYDPLSKSDRDSICNPCNVLVISGFVSELSGILVWTALLKQSSNAEGVLTKTIYVPVTAILFGHLRALCAIWWGSPYEAILSAVYFFLMFRLNEITVFRFDTPLLTLQCSVVLSHHCVLTLKIIIWKTITICILTLTIHSVPMYSVVYGMVPVLNFGTQTILVVGSHRLYTMSHSLYWISVFETLQLWQDCNIINAKSAYFYNELSKDCTALFHHTLEASITGSPPSGGMPAATKTEEFSEKL